MNNNPNRNSQRPPQQRKKTGTTQTQNHRPKGSYTSNFTIVCIIAVVLLVFAVVKVFSRIITDNPNVLQRPENAVIEEQKKAAEEEKREREIKNNFEKVSVNEDDTKVGNLILVNNDNAYSFDASPCKVEVKDLVSVNLNRTSNRYTVSDNTEKMTMEAIEAFDRMVEDFYSATGIQDLYIIDSTRTKEDQERIYASKGPEIATLPGHSEHHTGLAFDFSRYNGGKYMTYDGEGEYKWLSDNSYKYGYILRYPENKTDITQISYESWHYRYVGVEHATYMKQNDLCLEEYIDELAKYTLKGERLKVKTDDGAEYEIYSCPVSGDGEIYVPKDKQYTLSGDNSGHVIVSMCNS